MTKIYLQDCGNYGVLLHTETKSVHVKLYHGGRGSGYFDMDFSTADIINLDKDRFIKFSDFVDGDSPVEASLTIPEAGISSKFFQINHLVNDIKESENNKFERMSLDEKRKEMVFSYLKDIYFTGYFNNYKRNNNISEDLEIRRKLFNNDETLFVDLFSKNINENSIEGIFKSKLIESEFKEVDLNFGKYIVDNLKECAERALTSELHEDNIFERTILREFNLTDKYLEKLNYGFVNSSELIPVMDKTKSNPLTDITFKDKKYFLIIETDEGAVVTNGDKFILAKDTVFRPYKFDKGGFEPEVVILKEGDYLTVDDLKYPANSEGLKLLQILNIDDDKHRFQKSLIMGGLEKKPENDLVNNESQKQNKLKI